MAAKKSFITLDTISVRLQGKTVLHDISWEIKKGEQWAIVGPNGSGKSTLVRALFGGTNLTHGTIAFNFERDLKKRLHPALMKEKIGYVSFELHQKLMEQEDFLQALREFKGTLDEEYTSARDVVMSGVWSHDAPPSRLPLIEEKVEKIAEQLRISHLLTRNITALSTGEMRKTLIARALMKEPRLLILDEPFDGLDEASRRSLKNTIRKLSKNLQLILITHRVDEIPACITHMLLLRDGRIQLQGVKKKILKNEYLKESNISQHGPQGQFSALPRNGRFKREGRPTVPDILISLKNVRVVYGKTVALDGLSWEMKRGEHWAIVGPNGSGKSTIVKLIVGENVQGYANDIRIFGKKKGTSETLWDIKKDIGVVSGELQVQYRKNMNAFDVIASGFYDSIGLYRYPTKEQEISVREWANLLDITHFVDQDFHQLSYGQRRLVLIARAMVKSPVLLMLDEPCHGLDTPNRRRVLDIIEFIGSHTPTSLLYITHHPEEIVPCIEHVLELESGISCKRSSHID